MVSPPVRPPWTHGTVNLVRDLSGAMTRYRAVTNRGLPTPGSRIEAPSSAKLKSAEKWASMLAHVAGGRRASIWHFFFTPTATTARWARRMCGSLRPRSLRSQVVQTLCSAPERPRLEHLFAPTVITLSEHTRQRYLEVGADPNRLVHIPPCAAVPEPVSPTRAAEIRAAFGIAAQTLWLLYVGDLEFGQGPKPTVQALAQLRRQGLPAHLTVASRMKTPAAMERYRDVQRFAQSLGVHAQVNGLKSTEVQDISFHNLLGSVDLVLLPSPTLTAKMDYPLTLLEAAHLGRAIVVSESSAARELVDRAMAVAVGPGIGDLAQVIQTWASPSMGKALGETARVRAQEFLAPKVAAAHEALYDRMVHNQELGS